MEKVSVPRVWNARRLPAEPCAAIDPWLEQTESLVFANSQLRVLVALNLALLALPVACTTEAVSTVRDADPLGPCPEQHLSDTDPGDAGEPEDRGAAGLCREEFQADVDVGATQDLFAVTDLADSQSSADYNARIGQRCSLLNACNELSGRLCCNEMVKCTLDNQGLGICVAAGDRAEGEDCGADGFDDCVAGLFCVDEAQNGAGSKCYRFCNPLSPECPAASTCSERIPWAREAIGLCVP